MKETVHAGERPANDDGAIAQLGEHLPCKQRVEGSNPSSSTKLNTPDTKLVSSGRTHL